MLDRQTDGTVNCPSCELPVPVEADICEHCGRKVPGLWGYAATLQKLGADFGFTSLVTWGCIAVYIATLLMDIKGIRNDIPSLNILSPSPLSLLVFGASGSLPVFKLGRWWTVLSAGWLHGNFVHIAFNLVWIRQLAPPIGRVYGAGRLGIIYTISSVTGALLSSLAGAFLRSDLRFLQGATLTVGASGAVFGLLGALVSYGQLTDNDALKKQILSYVVVMFVFGLVMPNVDNWGHLGGFLSGYLISRLPGIDPRQPEGVRQLLGAIGCLVLIALSVAASVAHSFIELKISQ